MGNLCKCFNAEEVQIDTIEYQPQASAAGKPVVLVLPKIMVIDENDEQHMIFNPGVDQTEEEQRKIEELGVKVLKSPKATLHTRQRLMLVKPLDTTEEEEEEAVAGPSGMQLRRRSSSSQAKEYSSGTLIQMRAGIPASSILQEDPFDPIVASALRSKRRPKLELSLTKREENTERIRELASQLGFSQPSGTPSSPSSPESPMSPMEQYKFERLRGKCIRERKRRKSWW